MLPFKLVYSDDYYLPIGTKGKETLRCCAMASADDAASNTR